MTCSRFPSRRSLPYSGAALQLRGSWPAALGGDPRRHRRIVDAFLAASRNRDYAVLLMYLDPSVTLSADKAALELGAVEIHGAEEVARSFVGRMGGAKPALVNGTLGAVWIPKISLASYSSSRSEMPRSRASS